MGLRRIITEPEAFGLDPERGRDVDIFNRKFPEFELILAKPLRNYLRYMGSGGLNFRQLFPDVAISGLKATEFLLSPFARWLALHYVIALRKR
jgi:hypothetical protein